MKFLKTFSMGRPKPDGRRPGDATAQLPEPGPAILSFLIEQVRDDDGIHPETILSAGGALCGFAAQRAVWLTMIEQQRMPIEKVFVVVDTKDGSRFLFSDAVNHLLASEDPKILSTWRLVRDAAIKCGAKSLPDLEQIFARTAAGVGSTPFPSFSTPEAHRPREAPAAALRRFWPSVGGALDRTCDGPMHWPFVLGFVCSGLVAMSRSELDPAIAATLVMESAVAMSKMTGIEATH